MSKKEQERIRKAREKAFRQESQRLAIEGIGRSAYEEKKEDQAYLKEKSQTELKEAVSMLASTNSSLQESVKGQFGKKVTNNKKSCWILLFSGIKTLVCRRIKILFSFYRIKITYYSCKSRMLCLLKVSGFF